MSETIFAWLLRLYPSRFREEYGYESLQLFRDRARHETGVLPIIRLWFDLLVEIDPRTLFGISAAEASRGERHLEVNYELAARSRHHSQRSLTF